MNWGNCLRASKARMMMTRKKIKEYFDISETSYFSLLKSSEKWKEFFLEKEAILSLILSIIAIIALYQVCGRTFGNEFNELIRSVSISVGVALIGLLGFTISGLAIFTGTITNKLVKNIDDDNKGDAIINVLYSFYFIGGIDACEIIILLTIYLISYIDKPLWLKSHILLLLLSYIYFYLLYYIQYLY